MTEERPPTIDSAAAARWAHAAPPLSPWLHEEVGRRMQERLQWITLQPAAWCDWGAVRGGLQAHALVAKRFPQALCHVVEPEGPLAQAARAALERPWWNAARWTAPALRWEPPALGSVQMLWANMGLHMAADPRALIAQWTASSCSPASGPTRCANCARSTRRWAGLRRAMSSPTCTTGATC